MQREAVFDPVVEGLRSSQIESLQFHQCGA